MAVERCSVGFAGESGILHIVGVDAASVFEAAPRAHARVRAH
jgi:hypothetical protein